jgi:hypothetical protein
MVLALGLLSACASTPEFPPAPTVRFDQARAKHMLEEGAGTVAGKVLLRLSTGGALTCTKGAARLIPFTAYASAWADAVYHQQPPESGTPADMAYLIKSKRMPNARLDARFLATNRTARCDQDGQFIFERVQDGDYFLEADLIWQQDIYDELHFFRGREYYDKEGTVLKRFLLQGGKPVFLDLQWSVKNKRFDF